MNLIGVSVKHRAFGTGQVVEKTEEHIVVDFCGQEKRFVYPDAFNTFLRVEDTNIHNMIQQDMLQKEQAIQLQQEKKK